MSQSSLASSIVKALKVYKPKKLKPKFKPAHLQQKQKVKICMKGALCGIISVGKLKEEQDKLNKELKGFFKPPS